LLGLDTLHFLSLEGLLQAAGGEDDAYCKACIDGEYPLPLDPSPQAFKTIQTISQISPETNLIAAFVFGVIGTVGFAVFGNDMPAVTESFLDQ
jgi:hypothetical protein